ncbi:vitamin-D-receptor interacting mediator subunit 4-domain-containing protein [Biscogniauxia marginata]|nr:vitamin-D-receptor interacting mediator subunit 4-domain-containing protein [Biscogniauxia marginata]
MDKQLDTCFDRVERALGTLIDSIAKYNPSTHQVNELGKADEELNKGLRDLQTHQSNYRRIQSLRAATASLDGQIKDTLRLLANTRKELISTPATIFPSGPSYEIKYDELLSYARRISKTTIPPVGAVNSIPPSTLDSQLKIENGGTETAATTPGETPNGATQPQATAATPAASTNGAGPSSSSSSFEASQQTTANSNSNSNNNSSRHLPEHLHAHLNPHAGLEFVPWPSEEQVRKGAIASLAFLAEQGVDPEDYDPEEERARREREDDERRAREDRERAEREDRERRAREENARLRAERERAREREEAEGWRRASVSVGMGMGGDARAAGAGAGTGAGAGVPLPSASPTGEKKQFQFMGGDDDDDDD